MEFESDQGIQSMKISSIKTENSHFPSWPLTSIETFERLLLHSELNLKLDANDEKGGYV